MDAISIELLKMFKDRNTLSTDDIAAIHNCEARVFIEAFVELKNNNFITNTELDKGNPDAISRKHRYSITQAGKSYIYDLEEREKERRGDKIRYRITTAIAVAALIIAVFALFK